MSPKKLNIMCEYDSKCFACQFEVDYLRDRTNEHFGWDEPEPSPIRFTDLESNEAGTTSPTP